MLKKTCIACNKDRKKTKIIYDARFNPYCSRPYECNEDHPNSVTNLIKNGKQAQLFDYDAAVARFSAENSGDTIRLLDMPITVRLTDSRQAQFITKRCAELNITTSELIRKLIDEAAGEILQKGTESGGIVEKGDDTGRLEKGNEVSAGLEKGDEILEKGNELIF